MTTPVKERSFESDEKVKLPKPFILRRLHSLLGFWLVIYLCEHLLVNAQAAFFFQDNGYGFVTAVNHLESLPYLKVIEIVFLGLPFLYHGLSGMYYAWTAKSNAHRSDGTQPALPQYKKNRAYSWQRITAWILVVAILLHVIHMRFISYPSVAMHDEEHSYMVRVSQDAGLPSVAEKLEVKLFSGDEILQKKSDRAWFEAAEKKPLRKGEVLAVSPNAGGAFFLMVRETFKSPLMVILYSLFVVGAVYHAFNGAWTFMIKWGITLTRRSQKTMRTLTTFIMALVMLLGLWSAWGTYWAVQWKNPAIKMALDSSQSRQEE